MRGSQHPEQFCQTTVPVGSMGARLAAAAIDGLDLDDLGLCLAHLHRLGFDKRDIIAGLDEAVARARDLNGSRPTLGPPPVAWGDAPAMPSLPAR